MTQTLVCPTCQHSLIEYAGPCPNCGQAFCPECNHPLADEANACEKCGAEFGLFCSECEQEVDDNALFCPHCGASLIEDDEDESKIAEVDPVLTPTFSGKCPTCGSELFLEDGFCSECGTTFCTSCVKAVDEDDEICPHCNLALYFDCPLCNFELTTGTDQCPNCDALIPSYCTNCHAPLKAGANVCSQCQSPVNVRRRKSARIIHSLMLGDSVVQVASCPECGEQLLLGDGACSSCGYRFCSQCQISLGENEEICPRCGPHQATTIQLAQTANSCPSCDKPLQPLDEQCPYCGQLLCPECQAAIGEEDAFCPQCNTEFEFLCPQCDADVSADAEECPNCGFVF